MNTQSTEDFYGSETTLHEIMVVWVFPGSSEVKTPRCHCRVRGFSTWLRH